MTTNESTEKRFTLDVTGEESLTPDFILGPMSETEALATKARLDEKLGDCVEVVVKEYHEHTEADVVEHFGFAFE